MANLLLPQDIIFVPQGAEYQAVRRGIQYLTGERPSLVPIPMGMEPLRRYLAEFNHDSPSRILLMGLCGSLTESYSVGDVVLYGDCVYQGKRQECSQNLIREISALFSVSVVRGLTSDRLIWSVAEKRHLGEVSPAEVVDMEGFVMLEFFQQMPKPPSMGILRVVSDDAHHNIPDLTSAIDADGVLQPLPLAWGLIRQPIAATRLISGSLRGLKILEQVTKYLFPSTHP